MRFNSGVDSGIGYTGRSVHAQNRPKRDNLQRAKSRANNDIKAGIAVKPRQVFDVYSLNRGGRLSQPACGGVLGMFDCDSQPFPGVLVHRRDCHR